MHVVKRDGSAEPLNIEKIHRVVIWATEGLSNVSASEVEINSRIQFYDGIRTKDIHETLIKAAAELISADAPDYQHVAGRLVNYAIRKEVYGGYTPHRLYDVVQRNVAAGFYDPELLSLYTEAEFDEIESFVDHTRDMRIAYAGMEQLRGKYLVQNRVTGELKESPQIVYALVAATLFSGYSRETRMRWVRDYYDAISTHKISLPTPIMAGVRTPDRQFSSCVLIESGDSLDSIIATTGSIVKYVSQKAGIGIGAGRIRAEKSPVRGGKVAHTGVIPFYKLFNSAVGSCNQGGVRKGSATLWIPFWHRDFEDIVVLKNNKGTEDTRIRTMDFGIQFNRLAYERLISGGDISLFCPNDVPAMAEAFFADQDLFKALYEAAEANPAIPRKVLPAIELFSLFVQERKDTGRVYLQNVDASNQHSPFDEKLWPIKQSNLCVVPETQILTRAGYQAISNLAGQAVEIWNGEEWSVSQIGQTGVNQPVIKVTLSDGSAIECTPYHKFYVQCGIGIEEVRASGLREGDRIAPWIDPGSCQMVSVAVTSVVDEGRVSDTFCFNEPKRHMGILNGVLTGNCAEIDLPTRPLTSMADPEGRIALCTLSAINWGAIALDEMPRLCELAVRALDALLDYQDYPVEAARRATLEFRPLGVGIINLAYWLAKNGHRYSDDSSLPLVDEWMEAMSFYLIKASVDLAEERGPCQAWRETKFARGILPPDTRKPAVDDLVPHVERLDWGSLRQRAATVGQRNATLMAAMPAETSAQIANATNGIEPPRDLVSVKQSKHGVMKQVVPDIETLRGQYELLWDQRSPVGYLNICAVLQKWMDQGISVNTSYNPKFYPDEEIPLSDLLGHILHFYKFGGKQLYYNNTNDSAGEVDAEKLVAMSEPEIAFVEDDCDGCKI